MAEAASKSGKQTRRAPPRYSLRSGYSSFVTLMKLALPAVAVGLVLLIVIWPQFWDQDARFRLPSLDIGSDDLSGRTMVNPRFQGFDKENRPFNMTADQATQTPENKDLVRLANPKADIMLESGNWLALTAEQGLYDQAQQTMRLEGSVSLFHDDGFLMTTDRVTFSIEEGTASSRSPVEGQGPDGNLSAEGFRLADEGARIFLLGKSRVVLYETGEN